MALEIYGTPEQHRTPGGIKVTGTFKWTSTNATGDLNVSGLKVIKDFHFTPLGTYAVADGIRVNETPMTNGQINVGTDGTIAIVRDTGGTSAQYVKYALEGY